MSIPKELWRMVDYLLQAGCETSGLWTDKGIEGEDTIIRDALDEGTPFPSIEYVIWLFVGVGMIIVVFIPWRIVC